MCFSHRPVFSWSPSMRWHSSRYKELALVALTTCLIVELFNVLDFMLFVIILLATVLLLLKNFRVYLVPSFLWAILSARQEKESSYPSMDELIDDRTVIYYRWRAHQVLGITHDAGQKRMKAALFRLLEVCDEEMEYDNSSDLKYKMLDVVSAYVRLQQPVDDNLVRMSDTVAMYKRANKERLSQGGAQITFMFFGRSRLSRSSYGWDEISHELPSQTRAICGVSEEAANRNAQELIEEESREKRKLEKRKKKNQKKKQKKKQQKAKLTQRESESSDDDSDMTSPSPRTSSRTITDDDFVNYIIKHSGNNLAAGDNSTGLANKQQHTHNNKSSDSDSDNPEWDYQSAFFSKVAKNAKIKTKLTEAKKVGLQQDGNQKVSESNQYHTTHNGNKIVQNQTKTEENDDVVRSRELAVQGNKHASSGDFEKACVLFSRAIVLFDQDFRYYGNRSFCYERLFKFEKAFEDAERTIRLNKTWPKGYFRKGRALLGLKRLAEAETAFGQVTRLDPSCVEAEQEIHNCRVMRLNEMGFSRVLCELALKKNAGNFQLAIDELISGKLNDCDLEDVYISDDDEAKFFEELDDDEEETTQQSNELEIRAVWVGNLTAEVTEQDLQKYFSRFGAIRGIRTLYDKHCAFINFAAPECATRALQAGNKLTIRNTDMVMRYPDRPITEVGRAPVRRPPPPPPKPVEKIKPKPIVDNGWKGKDRGFYKVECTYWRLRGCKRGDECRYLHKPQSKGIDLDRY